MDARRPAGQWRIECNEKVYVGIIFQGGHGMKNADHHDLKSINVAHSRPSTSFGPVIYSRERSIKTLWPGLSMALRWFGLALTIMTPSLASAQNDDGDTWVVVHAGTLLAVPGNQPESQKTLVIKNGVIESVLDGYVPAAETAAVDAEVVSLKDRFVLPGLMDMHVHLRNGVPEILMDDARRISGTKVNSDADAAVIATSNAQTALMA